MKKLAIMQPYFFPYLGYWQAINAVDTYVVYDDVTYIKGGWINRNKILLNEQAHLITLPLQNSSSFKNINEIEIRNNPKIISKILRSIQYAYTKAPYFNNIMPILEDLIENNINIAQLNYNSIIKICEYLKIGTKIIFSSKLDKDNSLHAQDKVIHINKLLGSDIYINAIGGQELYDRGEFKQNGIELKFIKMGDIKYQQFKNGFVPNLSIIDVMMFNSVEKIKDMLNNYELI